MTTTAATTTISDYTSSTTIDVTTTTDATTSNGMTTTERACSTTTDDDTPTSTMPMVSYSPSCTAPTTYCASMIAEIIIDYGTCSDGNCNTGAHNTAQTDGAKSWLLSNEEWSTLSEPISVLNSYIYQNTCGQYDSTYTGYFSDAGCGTDIPGVGEGTTFSTVESTTSTNSNISSTTTSDSGILYQFTSTAVETTPLQAVTAPQPLRQQGPAKLQLRQTMPFK